MDVKGEKMKVSVVIVTYNRLGLLKECLSNAINQILKVHEVVVVNNCSTDGTDEFLHSVAEEDDIIKIVTPSGNLGGQAGFALV